jgi:hypothetical protein
MAADGDGYVACLGRIVWRDLHTMAEYEREFIGKRMVDVLLAAYPCAKCRCNLQHIPLPCTTDNRAFFYELHNAVNRSLHKPLYGEEILEQYSTGLDWYNHIGPFSEDAYRTRLQLLHYDLKAQVPMALHGG